MLNPCLPSDEYWILCITHTGLPGSYFNFSYLKLLNVSLALHTGGVILKSNVVDTEQMSTNSRIVFPCVLKSPCTAEQFVIYPIDG